MRRILLLVFAAAVLLWAGSDAPTEAHKYADSVLLPRFTANFNDWLNRHPWDVPGHEGEHCRALNAGDVARWGEVRKAFRELDAAYKRAGY